MTTILARLALPCLLACVAGGSVASAAPEPPAPAAPVPPGTPLDRYFKGRVLAIKGKDITLRYDFSDKAQLDDWREGVPWPIEKVAGQGIAWFDERLEVKGSTGARHKAEWAGEVWVTCSLTLDGDKDMGGVLIPADEGDSYASFSIMETYFHAWDKGEGKQHSILKFGKQWRESGSTADFIGFRYVARRPPSVAPKAGDVLRLGFGIQEGKLGMDTEEFELRGKDPGKRFKEYRPGFYTTKTRMLVDNVVITGRLSDAWMAQEKVALRTEQPLVDLTTEVDEATRQLAADYAAGKKPASDLVRVVGDSGALKPARDALCEALSAGPRRAVKASIDLLYKPDLESRAYGAAIVKRLLGKDYGYLPKASEDKRSESIRALNEDLKKNPGLLDGP
ncbi:MAG: hypothetical protein ACKOCB_12180 [Planctomycetia bacterium]